ncbi:MAG: hypothetical protein CMJ75_11925 [Planctomycetaceae bacterium]|nr:hypothetical protein [Planctomycetaceae bacterium]
MVAKSFPRWLRYPFAWLVVQGIVLTIFLAATSRLHPHATPDTLSYQRFPLDSLPAAFEHSRTCGYPIFLRVTGSLAKHAAAVPGCQLAVHFVAVCIFYLGVCRLLGSRWRAFAAASPLLYSNILFGYVNNLIADSLGSSISVATVGVLLWVVAGNRSIWLWLLLSAGCFATYQVRPAYLFLVLLLPLLGTGLYWMRTRDESHAGNKIHWLGSKLAACGLVPLFAYCAVRWWVIGHFALVSFGGNNFVGTVGVFLTPDMVSELAPDLQPLAETALATRKQALARHPEHSAKPTLQYMEIENRFDFNTWKVFVPSAQHVYGDDQPRVNTELRRLAVAIIIARPGYYLTWLAKAAWRGVCVTLLDLVQNPVYLGGLFGLLTLHGCVVVRTMGRLPAGRLKDGGNSASTHFPFNALLLVALLFAGMKLLLIIITTPPLGRFVDAGAVFFPALLGIGLFDRWSRLRKV